ncbi:beta-N-acetylglucosaminidase domain-containing protein [Streptomyces californicus]
MPGEGWRTLGELSPSGFTQTAAKGLRADAVRVCAEGGAGRRAPVPESGPAGRPAVLADGPRLRALVPWLGTTPPPRST